MLLCLCVPFGLYVHLLPTQLNTAIFRPFFTTVILRTPAGLNILPLCTCRCVRNHFVEKLDHSFVAISSGPTCWQHSISICSFKNLKNHLLEKLEQSKKPSAKSYMEFPIEALNFMFNNNHLSLHLSLPKIHRLHRLQPRRPNRG